MAAKVTPKRKPAKRRPVVDRKARESIDRIIDVLEDLVEQNERLWNSLYSAWVSIESLENKDKLAREARKLEKELNIQ